MVSCNGLNGQFENTGSSDKDKDDDTKGEGSFVNKPVVNPTKPLLSFDEENATLTVASSKPPTGWVSQFKWYRGGVIIEGQRKSAYGYTELDWKKGIKGVVRFVKGNDVSEEVSSDAYTKSSPIPSVPVLSFDPVSAKVKATLPKAPTGWLLHVRWYRAKVVITADNASSYTYTSNDWGKPITVVVWYSHKKGFTSVRSTSNPSMENIATPQKPTLTFDKDNLKAVFPGTPPTGWTSKMKWYREDLELLVAEGSGEYNYTLSDWGHPLRVGIQYVSQHSGASPIVYSDPQTHNIPTPNKPTLTYGAGKLTASVATPPEGWTRDIQWYLSDKKLTDIDAFDTDYTPQAGDKGKPLKIGITFVRDRFKSAEIYSDPYTAP